jgi:predicted ATPase
MRHLPSGTVTFLFTDIEGSTRLLRELGPDYVATLAEHRRTLREAFARHQGVEVDTQGDAFFVAFGSPAQAVAAAAESQAALEAGPIRVRMGLHTGEPLLTEEGYIGLDVHKGARIAASGHGGQVILSADTRALLDDTASLIDLGEHRLKDFDDPVQLYQLGDGVFPPLQSISNTHLPRPASSFIGRGREVDEVVSLLRDNARLVTLTGPGGTGKTRLGIEVAGELVPEFRAGVFWVGLAPIRDPALVTEAIGQTLGAKEDVAAHIGEREMLLLLDNFEQVVDAAPHLTRLVESCPNLALIVSSRELLRVKGEVEYAVPPLASPEAVTLFCERAQQEPSGVVAELCAQLDNLPLAVELAAARTKVLSPAQILDRLSERLDLFKGGRDAEPRQATLRATIEWSHDLLSPREQRLFARLAVFVGGCTLASAQAICDADLDTLQSLVEKSLLRHTDERFWMLETVREYSTERLEESGQAEDVQRRYFDHFLALAESAHLSAEAEYGRRHDLVLPETDNLRAAFDWAVEAGEIGLGFRLAISLENFWVTLDPFEGVRRFETLFAAGGDVAPILRARALRCYGGSSNMAGKHEQAQRAYKESLALFEQAGDERDAAVLIHRLGINALNLGKPELAREPLERSLVMFRRVGSQRGVAQAIGGLGYLAREEGNLDQAVELWEESLAMVRDSGFIWWQAGMLAALAEAALERGRFDEAAARAREQLSLSSQVIDRQNAVYALAYLARVAAEEGDLHRAGVVWGSIEVEESRAPVGGWEWERDTYESPVLAHAGAKFDQGRREGRRMAFNQAIEFALRDRPPS